jgi:hypothetical protein
MLSMVSSAFDSHSSEKKNLADAHILAQPKQPRSLLKSNNAAIGVNIWISSE